MQILPLATPDVDLPAILELANKSIGRVSNPADASKRPLTIYERWVSALSTMKDPTNSHITESLRKSYNATSHLHFCFAFISDPDTILKSAELSGLTHTVFDVDRRYHIAIVSGTVTEFRHAILDCTSFLEFPHLVSLYNEVYLYFVSVGFREVFNFRKQSHGDIFKLESQ